MLGGGGVRRCCDCVDWVCGKCASLRPGCCCCCVEGRPMRRVFCAHEPYCVLGSEGGGGGVWQESCGTPLAQLQSVPSPCICHTRSLTPAALLNRRPLKGSTIPYRSVVNYWGSTCWTELGNGNSESVKAGGYSGGAQTHSPTHSPTHAASPARQSPLFP